MFEKKRFERRPLKLKEQSNEPNEADFHEPLIKSGQTNEKRKY